MTVDQDTARSRSGLARMVVERAEGWGEMVTVVLGPLALLALRVPVGLVFWYSGRTKVEGWNIFAIKDSQPFLFEYEYGLPFPVLMAHVTALAEHVLPALLILGLLTRFAALGLLAMTAVIQAFIYTSFDVWWTVHMWWAATLFAVLALGPGRISLDHLVFGRRR